MKLFFKSCFLLNFLIMSLQVQANTYKTLTSKEQLAANAVWMLQNKEGANGTGFFITPNHIITNFHVLTTLLQINRDDLKDIKLLQETDLGMVESDIKITKITALSSTTDLAILETDKSTNSYLKINTNSSKKSKVLFSLGYPQGQFSKINQTGLLQSISDQLIVSVNHPNISGASGSPLLDADNQVLGVVVSSYKNLLYSVQTEQLNRLIKGDIGFQCKSSNIRTCIKKAIQSTVKKAQQGDPVAQRQLGFIYSQGIGVELDLKDSVYWTDKAAKKNNTIAQLEMGTMFFNGDGVNQDTEMALKLIRQAADQEYVQAQYNLGVIYSQTKRVEKDIKEAFDWFQQAAKQGHAPSQYLLGEMYASGNGTKQNTKMAVFWIKQAANQNHKQSQKFLKEKSISFIQKCRNIFS